MEEQTIRNLFEAFLQTSFLSPDDLVDLLRIPKKHKKDLAEKRYHIRNVYLDNLDNGSEEVIDEYIDELFRYIN